MITIRTVERRPPAAWRIVHLLPLFLTALLAGTVSLPLWAGMVYRFEPSVEIGLMHDGDVFNSTFEERRSDQLVFLRPLLPLIGESERTTMRLDYAPEAEFYTSYSDLNRLNHRAELALNHAFSRRGNWELGGVYIDTSNSYSQLLEGDLITTRSDRQLMGANTGFTVGVSRRADLSVRYAYRDLEYDDPTIVGHTSHLAGAAANLSTGPRSSIALDYAYQYIQYPERGDVGAHSLQTRYMVRPSAQTTLTLAGGIFFQDYQPPGTGGPEMTGNDNGFIGSIEWGRQGRRFGFSAGLSRGVRASGGIGQSVLSNAARVSMAGPLGRKTGIRLSGLYQRNEPTVSPEAGNVDIMRSSLDLDYELGRHFGLRFFTDYIYQQREAGSQRDLSYPRAGLSLVIGTVSAAGSAQPAS